MPADEADMSGIEIEPHRDLFVISRVEDDSPASRAGLNAGSFLEAVNDIAVSKLAGSEIRTLLKSGDGKTVTLKIQGRQRNSRSRGCAPAKNLGFAAV